MNKETVIGSLPVAEGGLTVRYWDRHDMDLLAQWPPYPFPYEPFNFSFKDLSVEAKRAHYSRRIGDESRVTLIIDAAEKRAIGYLSLVAIDWEKMTVNNMGFRIEPGWCNRGIGKRSMNIVCRWCFENGFRMLRFDVAASNARAIRCYRGCGFREAGTFWRDDLTLVDVDLDDPVYCFLREYVRFRGKTPQLKFLWMEKASNG